MYVLKNRKHYGYVISRYDMHVMDVRHGYSFYGNIATESAG
jgi:hypothetical protein